MIVLLTGVTGFIGSQVARILLKEDHTVQALIRNGSDTRRITDILPSLQVIEGSIADTHLLEANHIDLCIHMAWYAEHGTYWTSLENFRVLAESLELALHLEKLGCKRFVGVGTCVEYDTVQGFFSEEHSILRPTSPYAASKLAMHYALEQLGQHSSMESAWLRLFYIYGPMENPRRLVPYVIQSLLADNRVETTSGKQVRDYLHVVDVARAIYSVAFSPLTGAVNIGSGKPVSVREIVETIAELLDREDLLDIGAREDRPGDPPFICANVTQLHSTGWVETFNLRNGLQDVISWWREHGN